MYEKLKVYSRGIKKKHVAIAYKLALEFQVSWYADLL